MPVVSIVIPTYNRAHLVGDAIKSALAQTHRDCEVIVVDDGSDDDTPAVVSAFGTAIRYHRQRNSGVEAALNAGAGLTSGEYLYFLNDDDLLEPNAVEVLLALLEAHPEAAMAYGKSRLVTAGGTVLRVYEAPRERPAGVWSGRDELKFLLTRNYICEGAVLLRRECWERLRGFDPDCQGMCEDWDLWARVASESCIGYAPEVVLTVRPQPGSLLTRIEGPKTLIALENHRRMLARAFADPATSAHLSGERPRIEALHLLSSAHIAYALGHMTDARADLAQARRLYPGLFSDAEMIGARQLQLKLKLPGTLVIAVRALKRQRNVRSIATSMRGGRTA